jgi:GH15 family glucan-1,4-alpha-glucosidase
MSPVPGCPERYPRIEEYGFLSDGHTAALSGPDAAIEWLCAPRFDGPSVFGRLLDRDRGGAFELAVEGAAQPERRYLDGTLVLETRFKTGSGSVVVLDFLALEAEGWHGPGEVYPHHVLVRLATCERGKARVRARIDARPDYGRSVPAWQARDGFFTLDAPRTRIWASSDRGFAVEAEALVASFDLRERESAAFALRYAGEPVRRIDPQVAGRLLDTTVLSWRRWSGRLRYDGVGRELVLRSALVLKGLVFHESGALLAAPTTSLPEETGGERNWDYRFTWLRDATLALLAFLRLGYEHEGRDYMEFLIRECARCGARPHLMLGIGSEHEIDELELSHLEGYACSAPVRVGNGAHEQLQLDSYGAVLGAALVYQRMTGGLPAESWPLLRSLVEFTCHHWRDPDNGIWEVRGERRHFTHSKVMSWMCVDRGIQIAEQLDPAKAPLETWRDVRSAIRADVLAHGYDTERGVVIQAYGAKALDASALRFPLVGFLAADDPRMASTIDRIIDELESEEGLVHRYKQDEVDDGVPGGEGAFAICSFWLVSALVRAGRVEEAGRRFAALCDRASPLGLYGEELAPGGGMLGNFPQAFSHLALVQAAADLNASEDKAALTAWAERGQARHD